jgi:hypothetical protein
MPRLLLVLPFVAVLALGGLSGPARAGDPDPDEDPIPPLSTEAEAMQALLEFKKDYRAPGLKGDERTAMREVAMRKLARTQHALVADQLGKLTRDRDPDLKTLALLYLGYQRALPGYAGELVLKALKANPGDAVFAMFAIEAIERLAYRGAIDVLRGLLADKDDGVKKVAILYVGDAAEWRLIDDLLALMKELKIDQGSKTEGHEVRYDSGAAGDADAKMAEKIYHERYGSSARKARSGGRAMRDMKPVLLDAMKSLTGVDFATGTSARDWVDENKESIAAKQKALAEEAAEQAAAAAELR